MTKINFETPGGKCSGRILESGVIEIDKESEAILRELNSGRDWTDDFILDPQYPGWIVYYPYDTYFPPSFFKVCN